MKKTNENLLFLAMLFVSLYVISNAIAGRIVNTGIFIFGEEIIVSGAVLTYAATFLIADVIHQIYGKAKARIVVAWALLIQIIILIFILITKYLPSSYYFYEVRDAYNLLFGLNIYIVIGSLTAYFISQNLDIILFEKIKNKIMSISNNYKLRGIWNTASTLISQAIDTIIFSTIAFGVGFGWIFTEEGRLLLLMMIVGEYIIKMAIAILDTPVFYLLTSKER